MFGIGLMLMAGLWADPCGMVPPIAVTNTSAIARQGVQRTYVFFKDGIETIALRPGFIGSVEDFGMLIPFPSPPALRKIDDDTFAHIEAAIDPPKVFVRQGMMEYEEAPMADAGEGARAKKEEGKIGLDEVRVLNQEAVGMCQVAVLEAGSSKALARWMSDNGYRFPDGMEKVTDDYVTEGWCFVAIKAAVGSADGVNPKPGQRSVDPTRSAGSTFNGHVQGMAFRFKAEKPVVPMRLSVFNGVDPRNVVYMLTEQPVRIKQLSEKLVLKQVDGKKLIKTLTEPLSVEFDSLLSGFTMSVQDRTRLTKMRDYDPYISIAKSLFASDLLAVKEGRLSLPMEEREKEYLRVSEAFGLRGADVDSLHGEELKKEREKVVDTALLDVGNMHLSVIDGIFDSSVLSAQNLQFEKYKIPFDKGRDEPLKQHDRTLWVY
jgi:hypothetical protein